MRTWLLRGILGLIAGVGVMWLQAGRASAFEIYNQTTGHTVKVHVDPASGRGSQTFGGHSDVEITRGDSAGCHWENDDCNPDDARDSTLAATIQIDDGQFECKLKIRAGGYITVRETLRRYGPQMFLVPTEYRCDSWFEPTENDYSTTQRVGHEPRFSEDPETVHWLASSDIHFSGGDNTSAENTIKALETAYSASGDVRGIVINGDLTGDAQRHEWNKYLDALTFERYFFDSVGNHDQHHRGQPTECDFPTCEIPQEIADDIRDRYRVTPLTGGDDRDHRAFYSWDWGQVHVVQLGNIAANGNRRSTAADENGNMASKDSLKFLQQDLAAHVGDSGRPVIINTHVGFDCSSIAGTLFSGTSCGATVEDETYWTPEQRLEMWNAIKDYNIAAWFQGHLHVNRDSIDNYRYDFRDPTNATAKSIPVWITGPSGYFVDVTISRTGTGCFAHAFTGCLTVKKWQIADAGNISLGEDHEEILMPAMPPVTHDIGVFKGTGDACPGNGQVTITMDNEDGGDSRSEGWIGTSSASPDTRLEFCRVDGSAFHPATGDYAVLKLDAACPAGATEMTRSFDNEDTNNANTWNGAIEPNVSDSNTTLAFCFFPADASSTFVFPDVAAAYGVLGNPNGVFPISQARTGGYIVTDDEDDGNRNGLNGPVGVAHAQNLIAGGRNTTMFVAQVRGTRTTTVLTSDTLLAKDGVTVRFTATLEDTIPTGTVTFAVDGTDIGTVAVADGEAFEDWLADMPASGNTRHVTARYSGDGSYDGSTGLFTQVITFDPSPPEIALTFPSLNGVHSGATADFICTTGAVCGEGDGTGSQINDPECLPRCGVFVSLRRQSDGNFWVNGDQDFTSATPILNTATITAFAQPGNAFHFKWHLNVPPSAMTDGTYLLGVTTVDKALHVGGFSTGFRMDSTPPVISTFVVEQGTYNGPGWNAVCRGLCGEIDGTGSPGRLGLSVRHDGVGYWDGSNFNASTEIVHEAATSGTRWDLPLATDHLTDGNYTMIVYPSDGANNGSPITVHFKYDTTAPIVGISSPQDGHVYGPETLGSLCDGPTLCGSATDGGAGVVQVLASVKDNVTGLYWAGFGFSDNKQTWRGVNDVSPWSMAVRSGSFTDGHNYTVTVTARDRANNVGSATRIFAYDSTRPTGSVTTPADGQHLNTAALTSGCGICGTAADGFSGLQAAEVSIKRDGDGLYFDGTAFTTAVGETFLPATGTSSWSFHDVPAAQWANGPYTVVARLTDVAGNQSLTNERHFTVDFVPPVVTLTAREAPASTGWYRTTPSFSVSGADALSEPVACDSAFFYSGPDGAARTVTAKCIDAAGNVAFGESAPFDVDRAAPSATVTLSRAADHNGWYTAPFNMSWTWTDAASGVASSTAKTTYNGPDTGHATTFGTATDAAGNSATLESPVFGYDTTAPKITASPSGPMGANGWFTGPVTVHYTCTDATSDIASCPADQVVSAPGSTLLQPSATDNAGWTGETKLTVKIDAQVPTGQVTTRNGALFLLGGSITGTAQDSNAGVAGVVVKYGNGAGSVVSATVTCNAGRHSCTWSAPVPGGLLQHHMATATITDLAGNTTTLSPITFTRVL